MRAAGQRRGYAAGQARRERILAIALQEFAENGYRGTSLARIAERAEISQAGLLHHFQNKERLLVEVLEYRDELDLRRHRSGAVRTGAEALRVLVDVVEHNSRVPGLVQLFTVMGGEAVTADHPGHEWARDRYRRLRDETARVLARAVETGEFRSDIDPQAHAARLIAVMDGLQTQWLLDPERLDMAAVFRGHVEDLIAVLRP
ncbi:TetR family transcriptional regulator [Planobispora rosea]|uniref:TetR family transcriptional regulator n=1 Tax=Planobispora rosea TaxID=35762 RepID=A0A8J3WCH3_PLARO|nr:TetR/AcrR family transcriptional regulator [Planobispora rosea]GGS65861.1 TetR family transcriptional regulator [Planobispora rosea]GIH84964.1 TetR family transcriptional regulator [Planobispora rosea]